MRKKVYNQVFAERKIPINFFLRVNSMADHKKFIGILFVCLQGRCFVFSVADGHIN